MANEINLKDPLDKILFEYTEPNKTHALIEWVASDEPVLLKPSKGTFVDMLDGEKVTVPPRGKYFGRRSAVRLLLKFGRKGQHIGKHRPTGVTEPWLEVRPPEEQMFWTEKKGVTFRDQFLYHDTKEEAEEESLELVGAKAN